MYDVIDVCNYIINYCNDNDCGISNLKLQKILYFVQANFLMQTARKCFSNKIMAWDFGPVIPESYRKFSKYGGCNIYSFSKFGKYNRISKKDKKYIDEVIEKFKDYSAADLTKITQNQTPWLNAYSRYCCNEITPGAIKKYFLE